MPISVTSQPAARRPWTSASRRRVELRRQSRPTLMSAPAAMAAQVGAEATSQLLDIGTEEFGIGDAADVVLAENGRLEHISILSDWRRPESAKVSCHSEAVFGLDGLWKKMRRQHTKAPVNARRAGTSPSRLQRISASTPNLPKCNRDSQNRAESVNLSPRSIEYRTLND